MDMELEGLLEALKILNATLVKLSRGPLPVYTIVLHALRYVDEQISDYLYREN